MSEEKKAKRSSSEKSASQKEIDVINGIRRWVDRLPEHRKVAVLQFVTQGIDSARYARAGRQMEELTAKREGTVGGACAPGETTKQLAAFD